IAFGGRTLRSDKTVAKYINSPESEAFVKNKSLYGIYEAKAAIVREQKCYLVEGYTDVISFHQAGIENVVASGGTSLTSGQIGLIKRFSNKITVLYDGDFAGIKASLRGIDMLLAEGMEVKVALFPDGEDPDSYAKKHDAAQVREFLDANEEDFIAFKCKILSSDIDKDPLQRARLIGEIVNSIAVIPDAIVRNVYVETTSARLNISQELLQQEIKKIREKKQEEDFKARQRKERLDIYQSSFNAPAGVPAEVPAAGAPANTMKTAVPGFVINTYCEEAEKEILYYLLKFGCLNIHLEADFLYGSEPGQEQKVSDYILSQLQNDDLELQNLVYKNIFDEYFNLGAQDDEKAFKYFINHPDSAVAKTVIDILAQPYTITIAQFNKSMVPEKNVLGRVVPKSIMVYKAKVMAQASMNLAEELKKAQSSEDLVLQEELMQQLNTLMQVRNAFAKELKRIIF
ncbi:MAG: toprim domain-containing protein, partial [Bacteroidales bacterium]|nr:toprim domain-containing protein [Bacteroidales bacterium]